MPDSTSRPLRIGFAGTPEFACRILSGLLAEDVRPVLVLTAPDRARGRGRRVRPTPVRELADEYAIEVLTPTSLKTDDSLQAIASYRLDVLIVAAFGLILPAAILALPRLGCLNVHPSLLPRWRGAAPIERALMAGDATTGVCIMQMEEGLDTGPVYDSASLAIHEDTTGDDLRAALADLGLRLLLGLLARLGKESRPEPTPQASQGITYAHKVTRDDQGIAWSNEARLVVRQIHALNSAAPAFSGPAADGDIADIAMVRFLRATSLPHSGNAIPGEVLPAPAGAIHIACGAGCISLVEACVLRGAARRLGPRALLNGFPELFTPGNRFVAPQA